MLRRVLVPTCPADRERLDPKKVIVKHWTWWLFTPVRKERSWGWIPSMLWSELEKWFQSFVIPLILPVHPFYCWGQWSIQKQAAMSPEVHTAKNLWVLRHKCESHTQEFESAWSHIHQCFFFRGFHCHIVTFSLWHTKKSWITLYREQYQNLFLKVELIDPPVLPFGPFFHYMIKIEFSSFRTKFYSD